MIFSRDTAIIAVCIVCALVAAQFQPSKSSVEGVLPALSKAVAQSVEGGTGQQYELREVLAKIAQYYNAEPINPRVDSVWKLIPGLNGVRLDIPATLAAAKQNSAQIPLIFQQIPPSISLNDYVAEPIYRGNPQKRQMALMINVAWGTEYIPQILSILRQNGVRATFFLDGSWAKKNPEVAKSIVLAGMEIGSHAYNHPMMSRLSREQMINQLTKTNEAIFHATGQHITLFAPPAGDFNNLVVQVAAGMKMKTILWTLDTIDWRKPSPTVIVSRIVKRRTPGALVLMHPTEPTVQALPEMIRSLKQDGYQLVTVSELLSSVRPVPKTLAEAQVALSKSGKL
ncbi:hypothetical protein BM613_04665 [Sulfoacidibacillus thermotolerans]|uniref:NodB homology domain-containing protein n=2 Tax=Sulfoacidibacillus thermotolerans TaxID=1765684 RepID=A0A2U3DAG7_SULT2|nr:hypothetical protein BM613_04665 [Sulfoacidibacillus thermotolerans]